MSDLPTRWREILAHRSVADKVAIPRDCELLEPGDLPAITSMVQAGVLEHNDTATLPFVILHRDGRKNTVGVSCDIYRLTADGIELCERNGIKQR